GERGGGEDEHGGGGAGEEPVADGADRPERAVDLAPGLRLELRRQRRDQTLRGAAREDRELHARYLLGDEPKAMRQSRGRRRSLRRAAHAAQRRWRTTARS